MENDKTIKPVEGGQIKKKSEFEKILDAFIPDNKPNIGASLLKDIIAPNLKKLTYEIIDNALSMFLWGEGSARNSYISGSSGRINYQRISTEGYTKPQTQIPVKEAGLNELAWFEDRGRAETALMDLQAAAERSKCITVADLYSVTGKDTDNYQAHKYGWSSEDFLSSSKVVHHISGGWYIKLPKPYQI